MSLNCEKLTYYGFTVEWCSNCQEDVTIPDSRKSKCPVCGEDIRPCGICEVQCKDDCPFDKE